MRTWCTCKTVPASPQAVLQVLTEPEEIARWAPVPFERVELDGGRLARDAELWWAVDSLDAGSSLTSTCWRPLTSTDSPLMQFDRRSNNRRALDRRSASRIFSKEQRAALAGKPRAGRRAFWAWRRSLSATEITPEACAADSRASRRVHGEIG
jgi:hypothetical protein